MMSSLHSIEHVAVPSGQGANVCDEDGKYVESEYIESTRKDVPVVAHARCFTPPSPCSFMFWGIPQSPIYLVTYILNPIFFAPCTSISTVAQFPSHREAYAVDYLSYLPRAPACPIGVPTLPSPRSRGSIHISGSCARTFEIIHDCSPPLVL